MIDSNSQSLADVYERVRHVVTEPEWQLFAPLIAEINRLKRERSAVILAHNYQAAVIYHGIADITGDSLQLAAKARDAQAEVLVVCGVHFMAETAKLLNPDATVILPHMGAGCSLADSITAADVLELRARYPGVPVVSYVNTSAAVKAVSDICCTSSNAVQVVESLGASRVIFLPDEHLARFVASQTETEIIAWSGECIVHVEFRADEMRALRRQYPEIKIIAHPECRDEVLREADYVGSTTGLVDYIAAHRPPRVALITECTMADNVAAEFAGIEFIQPCALCPYMKRITLEAVRDSLLSLQPQIEIAPEVAHGARQAVGRMLGVAPGVRR
ncbi:MAG: quinolinate synthase NadA [Bradymonadaceae bacterium]|nr:quinolinate synthase NadA [Lujinxingiaceae bacterium]